MLRYQRHPHDEESFTCPCGRIRTWGRRHYIACRCGVVHVRVRSERMIGTVPIHQEANKPTKTD